ncbi:uncharacterized protein LOC111283869 [Durio zibethinus]|uniref:Uncharacterized protein LOC111283869 n=1 Tax=Durio zibethinus TaxID=66656 RepID=A0A6P5XK33_DURZI|nr:uncharacterized protein LOC111283869 [Durio zibethinus]
MPTCIFDSQQKLINSNQTRHRQPTFLLLNSFYNNYIYAYASPQITVFKTKSQSYRIFFFFFLCLLFSQLDMDIKSKVVDVSSFLLFEATGDSESGCFDPAISVINHDEDGDDDNDAESCSCDTTSDFLHRVRELNSLEEKVNVGDDHHEDEEDGEVVEQKEVCAYKKCRDDYQNINGVAKEKKPSTVSLDSTKTKNEMEKNKLFWEACLAS